MNMVSLPCAFANVLLNGNSVKMIIHTLGMKMAFLQCVFLCFFVKSEQRENADPHTWAKQRSFSQCFPMFTYKFCIHPIS